MRRLELRLRPTPARSVPLHVGRGALELLVEEIVLSAPRGRVAVVSDSNVGPIHGEGLCRALRARGLASVLITFPAGEANKTRESKSRLEDLLLEHGADRATTVVALGGGVTGDLAGFLASTWNRGVPLIQAPTSLLAMVDAAIGGKTAVDLPGGKNLVGSFYQPIGVFADPSVLSTLPAEQIGAGLAEAVKTAVVADPALFRRLEQGASALLSGDAAALEEVIVACVRAKARIVARDERETGRRAVLNFGHTVAHGLETASGYRLAHGPAVSVGMVVESALASKLVGFPERHARRLRALLARLALPSAIPAGIRTEAALDAIARDKKVREGVLHLSLPLRIGRMPAGGGGTTAVAPELLAEQLDAARIPGAV